MSMYTNNPISSDDPQAIEKLKAKLAKLTSTQERMKNVNAYYRKHGTLDGCTDLTPEQIEKLKANMSPGGKPFLAWQLSNNSAEIRRVTKRIEALTRRENTEYVGWKFNGGNVEANSGDNRLQIFFNEKPDEDTRASLKSNGFKWAPSVGAWQRQLNDNAIYAANRIKAIQPVTGERPTDLQPNAG